MSTRIEDLPKIIKTPQETTMLTDQVKKEIKNENLETKEQEKDNSILSFFKNEISEENLLLLILFFIASISIFDVYISHIPFLNSYIEYGSWAYTLVKSVVLLILFIVGKKYILPKFQI